MLFAVDWFKQMEKINLAFGENNNIDHYGGKKRLVSPFRMQDVWKYIG